MGGTRGEEDVSNAIAPAVIGVATVAVEAERMEKRTTMGNARKNGIQKVILETSVKSVEVGLNGPGVFVKAKDSIPCRLPCAPLVSVICSVRRR